MLGPYLCLMSFQESLLFKANLHLSKEMLREIPLESSQLLDVGLEPLELE